MGDENFAVLAPEKGPAKTGRFLRALPPSPGLRATAFEGPGRRRRTREVRLGQAEDRDAPGRGRQGAGRVRVGRGEGRQALRAVDGSRSWSGEKGTVDDWPWTVLTRSSRRPPRDKPASNLVPRPGRADYLRTRTLGCAAVRSTFSVRFHRARSRPLPKELQGPGGSGIQPRPFAFL